MKRVPIINDELYYLRISQVVDPKKTARMELPLHYLTDFQKNEGILSNAKAHAL